MICHKTKCWQAHPKRSRSLRHYFCVLDHRFLVSQSHFLISHFLGPQLFSTTKKQIVNLLPVISCPLSATYSRLVPILLWQSSFLHLSLLIAPLLSSIPTPSSSSCSCSFTKLPRLPLRDGSNW